jgi:EEF1A lysine methyltransferase 4
MNANFLVPLGVGQNEFDTTYSDNAQYGRIQFWDERYSSFPEPFEWYYDYFTFKSIINDEFPNKDAKIMIAGCGNSHFIEDMADDGYTDLIGVDKSRVAIAIMKRRTKGRTPEIKFHSGTMQDTDLEGNIYDGVIDKALMDALFCTNTGANNVKQYVMEVDRLLCRTGKFIVISHGKPEDRIGHLEQLDTDQPGFTPWRVDVQAVAKMEQYDGEVLDLDDPDNSYFIYIATKIASLVDKKIGKAIKDAKNAKKKKQQQKIGAPQL